ncbi:pyridoxal-phosphate dependent enzyme [Paraburkholderia sp. MM5477-R1]|uniref:pyridoxal-phosphate dependent enzyme n=1 Tax=Paraburkholderia sp. MM5477-R1 TaxID=2991062 RepID=UPI003D196416
MYTASTGNFALGLTQAARARQAGVRVYVTKTASQSKIAALRELGAKVVAISFEKCGPSSAVKSRWTKTERSFIRARVAMSSPQRNHRAGNS